MTAALLGHVVDGFLQCLRAVCQSVALGTVVLDVHPAVRNGGAGDLLQFYGQAGIVIGVILCR